MYLEKFTLKDKLYTINPFEITFQKDLNIIVGENGSGKSTLLKLLTDINFNKGEKIITLTEECKNHGAETMFFDTEKHNPRIKEDCSNDKNIGYTLHSRFCSHGQSLFPIINHIKKLKNTVIFIDEPESGISLSNQLIFLDSIKEAIKNNCQIIISTHSYVLIKNVKNVFDMSTFSWFSSELYLNNLGL
jgi:predicted ATPase